VLDYAASRTKRTHVTTFAQLGCAAPLCRALEREGYRHPTPIQTQAIPPLLQGRDLLGCAQTGTGKTAAFALPVLQHLMDAPRGHGKRAIRALVLTPTRELAAQIGDSFTAYGQFVEASHTVIFGGVNEKPQIEALRRGTDTLIATPGRLLDLMGRGFVHLDAVDFFVLDEADRMLDMGFVHDVRRVIAALPSERQNLLFSATMPPTIVKLAASFLVDPVHVEVAPPATTVELVEQVLMFVAHGDKKHLLASLLHEPGVERSIVFTRTKHGANRLAQQLHRAGIQDAAAIHGNKSLAARERALASFRSGDIRVLIATDIAARGIDIDDVTHVFNYDLPNIPESYVHRIGRTARAGRKGVAISFCDDTEAEYLRDIEKTIGIELMVDDDHAWHAAAIEALAESPKPARKPAEPASGHTRHPERPANGGGGRGGRGKRGPGRDHRGAASAVAVHARPGAAPSSRVVPPSSRAAPRPQSGTRKPGRRGPRRRGTKAAP
jgi:ATP-dependent RNA helicase RhlE